MLIRIKHPKQYPIVISLVFIWLLVAWSMGIAQTVKGMRSVDVRLSDAVYDSVSNRIYAATKATSPQFAQSVVVINPSDLTIPASLSLPAPADIIKLSGDGNYLYAVVRKIPSAVFQIDVRQMRILTQYTPTYSDATTDSKILDVLPIPGYTGRLAISFTDQWGNFRGTAAFDGVRRLSKVLDGQIMAASLYQGPTAGLMYGYDSISTGFTVARIKTADDGLELIEQPISGMAWGFHRNLAISQGLLYGANGTVSNVETKTQEGAFRGMDPAPAFVIDERTGVIYFVDPGSSLFNFWAFDLRTFLPVAGLKYPPGSSPRKLLLTNDSDLVVFTEDSSLIFIPTTALTRFDSFTMPSVEQVTPNLRILRAPATHLTADPVNHRLYFVTPSDVVGAGNSVFALDTTTGQVSLPAFAGADPAVPVVSNSGRFLYLSLNGEGEVLRFKLPELALDAKIKLRLTTLNLNSMLSNGQFLKASQILPLPTNEESFAVVQAIGPTMVTTQYDSLVLYDGIVRRQKSLDREDVPINSIAISADGTKIFGLTNEARSYEFSQVSLNPEGLVLDRLVAGIGTIDWEELQCDGDMCITTAGTLLDPQQIIRLGMVPGGGHIIPDRARNRLYVLVPHSEGREFIEYDAENMIPLRRGILPIPSAVQSFVRWAENGFAALTGDGIWLISADALTAIPPKSGPTVNTLGLHRVTNLATRAMVYDNKRQLIYASVPATITGTEQLNFYTILGFAADHIESNTVVAMDPATGRVVKSIIVGSDPGTLDISSDGSYLYVGLTTANAIVRIDLNRWVRDRFYRVPGSPNILRVRPGRSDDFVVAFGPGIVDKGYGYSHELGLWLYQGGQRLSASALTNARIVRALFTDTNSLVSADLYNQYADSKIHIVSTGLSADSPPEYRSLGQRPLAIADNRLFGSMGVIADSATLRFLEEVAEYGPVVPVPNQNRIYYLRRDGVRVYDWTTHSVMGSLPFTNDADHAEMMYCGPKCLAIRTLGSIALLNTEAIQWENPADKRATRTDDGLLHFPIRLTDMKYDVRRKVLYLTAPAGESVLGNSVVPINPATGQILDPIFVGTFPTGMALTEDGSRMYVATRGSRDIKIVDLQSRQMIGAIPVPQINPRESYWVEGLSVRPGTQNVLGLSASDGETWWNWRAMMIGSDGKMLPSWTSGTGHYVIGNNVFFSPSGTYLQVIGFDSYSGSGGMWNLPIISSGVQYVQPRGPKPWGSLARCSGLIFAPSGDRYDAESLDSKGKVELPNTDSFRAADAVACDESQDRLYYIGRNNGKLILYTYQLSTKTQIETRELPQQTGTVAKMEALGSMGLAYWISDFPSYNGPYVYKEQVDELVIIPGSGSTTHGTPYQLASDKFIEIKPFGAQSFDEAISGYSSVQPDLGSSAPVGYAFIANRHDGVIVSEVAVPLSNLMREGMMFAEIDAGINTGIAVANPNGDPAVLAFEFKSADGRTGRSGTITVAGNNQITCFFDQVPFNIISPFLGAMTFRSSLPIGISAIRKRTNERSEILMSLLPVSSLTATQETTATFAHFIAGDGWTTDVILTNPTYQSLNGIMQFLDGNGEILTVAINGQIGTTFNYQVNAGTARRFRVTSGLRETQTDLNRGVRTRAYRERSRLRAIQTGSVRIVGAAGMIVPSGALIFSHKPRIVTVTETSAALAMNTTSARIYAENIGQVRTGIALANPFSTEISVVLELTDRNGLLLARATTLIPGNGHTSLFLDDVPEFATLAEYQGLLRVTAPAPGIQVLALHCRTNERGELLISAITPIDETLSSNTERIFPQIMVGGPNTTSIILFNSDKEQSFGTINVSTSDGTPINVRY